NSALPATVLRELTPNAYHGHRIWLCAGLQMAVLAGKVVTGKTLRHARHSRTDLVRRIGEQRVPVFDKSAERIVINSTDLGRGPLRQIDRHPLCGRRPIAARQYRGTQHTDNAPKGFHRLNSRERHRNLSRDGRESMGAQCKSTAQYYGAFEN